MSFIETSRFGVACGVRLVYARKALANLTLRAKPICPFLQLVPAATGCIVTAPPCPQTPNCLPSAEQTIAPGEEQEPDEEPAAAAPPDDDDEPEDEPEDEVPLEGEDTTDAAALATD